MKIGDIAAWDHAVMEPVLSHRQIYLHLVFLLIAKNLLLALNEKRERGIVTSSGGAATGCPEYRRLEGKCPYHLRVFSVLACLANFARFVREPKNVPSIQEQNSSCKNSSPQQPHTRSIGAWRPYTAASLPSMRRVI